MFQYCLRLMDLFRVQQQWYVYGFCYSCLANRPLCILILLTYELLKLGQHEDLRCRVAKIPAGDLKTHQDF